MTTPQTIEQHAEAVLEAATLNGSHIEGILADTAIRQAILTALTAYGVAVVLAVADWIEPQRNDIPACGDEFSAAIRLDANAVIKGMGHG